MPTGELRALASVRACEQARLSLGGVLLFGEDLLFLFLLDLLLALLLLLLLLFLLLLLLLQLLGAAPAYTTSPAASR